MHYIVFPHDPLVSPSLFPEMKQTKRFPPSTISVKGGYYLAFKNLRWDDDEPGLVISTDRKRSTYPVRLWYISLIFTGL